MAKNVKKIIRVLCSAIFCTVVAVGMPQMAKAAEVTIDATNFPDEVFREYITSEFDNDENGKLSDMEVLEVKSIMVTEVETLKGIEYFTVLESLDCAGNFLDELDLSHNTTLKELNCSNNSLKKLDISYNKILTSLNCSGNLNLQKLDISKNIALESLNCCDCSLIELDLSYNTALRKLYCNNNELKGKGLDLSHNTTLESLSCLENNLTELDLSHNTTLIELRCDKNKLTKLNLSHNTVLESLSCRINPLTELKLNSQTYDKLILDKIFLHGFNIEGIEPNLSDLQNVIEINKDEDDNSLIKVIDITKPATYKVNGKDFTIIYADTVIMPAQTQVPVPSIIPSASPEITIDKENFPDTTFRHYIIANCDFDSNGRLSEEEIKLTTEMPINYKFIKSLKGVEYFTALTYLDCNSQLLTELDLSHNTVLTYLRCDGNELTKLDLSYNTALTYLCCDENQLTELKLNSQTYNKLALSTWFIHGEANLSNLQNVTEINKDENGNSLIKVIDITKPATYKVNGKDFTIIYVDTAVTPSASPSISPVITASPTPQPIRTSSPVIFPPVIQTPIPTVTPVPSPTPIPTATPTPTITAQPSQTPVATVTPVASADVPDSTVKPINTFKPENTQAPTAAPTAKPTKEPASTSRPLSTIQRNKALFKEMKVSKKLSIKKGKSKKVKLSLPDDVTVVKKFSGKDGEVQVKYYTSDTGVATINKKGKIKAKKKGSVDITTVVTFENKMSKAFSTKVKVKKNKKAIKSAKESSI